MDDLMTILGRALASPLLTTDYVSGLLDMTAQLSAPASASLGRKLEKHKNAGATAVQDKCASATCMLFVQLARVYANAMFAVNSLA